MSTAQTSDWRGKWTIVTTVPSLDTPVCSTQAQQCEAMAKERGQELQWVVISEDTPFAQKRWLGEHMCHNVQCFSDAREHAFAKATGLWIDDWGVLARGALLVDPQGVVQGMVIAPEVSEIPDYELLLRSLAS
ncbi:MAG: redoxin domain-containing protein [Chlamydiia bacterium]